MRRQMRQKKEWRFLLLSCCLPFLAHAGTMSPSTSQEYSKVITATVGADFVNQGASQSLTLLPSFQNHYSSNHQWKTGADFGFFLGAEYPLTNRFRMQTGVAGYGTTPISIEGDTSQSGISEPNDFTYHYKVQSSRLMLSNKILAILNKYSALHPYITGEIGIAFNLASGYQDTSAIAPFENSAYNSFSWALGAGGEYDLNANTRIGIGYQIADFGATSLGIRPEATPNQTLSMPHLWSNQLRVQVSYLLI